jgi:hypothetical protein
VSGQLGDDRSERISDVGAYDPTCSFAADDTILTGTK